MFFFSFFVLAFYIFEFPSPPHPFFSSFRLKKVTLASNELSGKLALSLPVCKTETKTNDARFSLPCPPRSFVSLRV